MKTRKTNTVRARFAPAARFTLPVNPVRGYRDAMEAELERLKDRLLAEELARTATLQANVLLRRAANEALALAWTTSYPLLLLPGLFEEKARTARQTVGRQALIRERSSDFLALAE